MNKFHVLKNSFKRELAKIRKVKSGSGGNVSPKWKHFLSLSFLTDVVTPGESTSNLIPSSQESQASNNQWMVVHTEPYLDTDTEIIHQLADSAEEEQMPLERPLTSLSTSSTDNASGIRLIPVESSQEHQVMPSQARTPKRKKRSVEGSAAEVSEAIGILRNTAAAGREEGIPHISGSLVRELFSTYSFTQQFEAHVELVTFLKNLNLAMNNNNSH